jgi:hypothetical protein
MMHRSKELTKALSNSGLFIHSIAEQLRQSKKKVEDARMRTEAKVLKFKLHAEKLSKHKSEVEMKKLLKEEDDGIKDANVLRLLLKILSIMYKKHSSPRNFVLDNDLYELVQSFTESTEQVLVSEFANKLLIEFQATASEDAASDSFELVDEMV